MALIQSLSMKGKIALGATAAGVLLALFLVFTMATKPSFQVVQAGMDPASAAKVTDALGTAGVSFELRDGGTSVAVKEADAPQARMALATAGITKGGASQQPGFELLDKQKLGSSSFQQQVAYQRALEGQIAQTIGQMGGVGSAQVRLTMPKDELFADESKAASAAVVLGTADVDPATVKGIASVVASSVPDLETKRVTITDSGGRLVWPAQDGAAGSTSKASVQARYEQGLQTSVEAMLARTLGPDAAQVRVNADLDANESSQEKLEYATKGTPLSSDEETETLRGTGGSGSGGAAGTATNVPGYAQASGSGGNSNYRKTSKKTEFGVNKTVTRTRTAPGTVNRLSVSVLVDKNLKPAPDTKAITDAVTAAVGAQPGRDRDRVAAVPFAKAPAPPAASPLAAVPPGVIGALKTAGGILVGLLFLFFVSRGLRKREAEAVSGEPAWLRELQAGNAGEPPMLGAGGFDDTLVHEPEREMAGVGAMAGFNDPRRQAVEELIEREPERVAAQLRTWITEEGK